jgi:hypothetical protein
VVYSVNTVLRRVKLLNLMLFRRLVLFLNKRGLQIGKIIGMRREEF